MKVFSYLNLADKKLANLVCIYWNDILGFWTQLKHNNIVLDSGSVDYVMESTLPREEIRVKDLNCKLNISSHRNTWIQDTQYLKFLRGDSGTTGTNIVKILRASRNLVQLKFESGTLRNVDSPLTGLRLNLLTTLTVSSVYDID